jgi:hypothetical protein
MRMSSTVITGIEGEDDTKVKDEESRDIWCEALESKIHSECDIPEELWGNWPMKEEMNIAYLGRVLNRRQWRTMQNWTYKSFKITMKCC